MTVAENFIRYALKIGALELIPEGRKLANGRISPYFFNSGLFNTGESLSKLAGILRFSGKESIVHRCHFWFRRQGNFNRSRSNNSHVEKLQG